MEPQDQTERDRQARDIFLRALELASPEARAAYLEGACQHDAALRARVEALLRSHQQDSFLEAAAIHQPPTVLAGPPLAEGPGTLIGRYKLLEKLGEGGMGVVYMAEQTEPVVRKVALLVKHPDPRKVGPTPDVAENYARFAVKLAPENAEAWHALGTVYFLQGRPEAALAAVDRALELQPGDAGAWEVRGELLERTNRLAEALAAFTRQVESLPATTNQEPAVQRIASLHRARVLRKLDRLDEAAREISMACGVPPRDAQASPALIDLSAFYTAGLIGNWHHRSPEGDLSELPTGLVELAGTRFDVRGLIQLHGATAITAQYPGQVTGLPVPPKFRRVHFLHSAIARHPTKSVGRDDLGAEIGKYVFHYADGTIEERLLIAGRDVWDWTSNLSEQGATNRFTVAWTAPGPTGDSSRQLYKSTWENPKPDVEVTGMDFVSAGRNTAPFLVAITVEPD